MTKLIYSKIEGTGDLKKVNMMIRKDVTKAKSRTRLTTLYRRSLYLVTLLFGSSWKTAFRGKITSMRKTAKDEFSRTARAINRQAKKIGTEANYDTKWGVGK